LWQTHFSRALAKISTYMRIPLFLILAFNLSYIQAQDIQFKLLNLDNEREQVRKDTFNIHLKTTIEPELAWFQAIEPNWTNIAGIIRNGKMHILFTDSINDGLLRHNYIYQNNENKDYIVVSVRSFDDGPSEMLFFQVSEKLSEFIGSIALFKKHQNSDYLGDFSEIYPKEQLKITLKGNILKLNFIEGFEYIYRHNYKEQTLSGPLSFELIGNEFQLVN
jgi:hypothetical protein